MKYSIKILLFFLLCCTSLTATSIDGTSSIVYETYHRVFRNNNYIRGFAAIKNGFTVLAGSNLIVETSLPLQGDIDLQTSGKLTLSQDAFFDHHTTITNNGTLYGVNTTLFLNSDFTMPAHKVLHCDGNLTINGQGHTLYFDNDSQLFIDHTATLTLRNMTIRTKKTYPGQPALNISSSLSTLALDNILFYPEEDLHLRRGRLFFHNDVIFTGTHALVLSPITPATIASESCLYFDHKTTLSFTPPTNTNNLLAFQDETSKLYLDGCSLKTTFTGINVTNGTLFFKNNIFLDSLSAQLFNDLDNETSLSLPATINSVTWSPNGKYIAIATETSGEEVLIAHFSGTSLTITTSVYVGAAVNDVSWTPDGHYLALAGTRSNEQIMVYSFEDEALNKITSLNTTYDATSVSWSPCGRYLLFTKKQKSYGCPVYAFNGATLSLSSYCPSGIQETSYSYAAAWSPDGRYISLTCTNGGSQFRCFKFIDGSDSRLIYTFSADINRATTWSPDGKYTVAGGSLGASVFFIINNEVIEPAMAAIPSADAYSISWSPSGEFVAIGITAGLKCYRFQHTNALLVKTVSTTAVSSVAFSPDGQKLAWATGDTLYIDNMICNPSLSVYADPKSAIILGNQEAESSHDVNVHILADTKVVLRGNIIHST